MDLGSFICHSQDTSDQGLRLRRDGSLIASGGARRAFVADDRDFGPTAKARPGLRAVSSSCHQPASHQKQGEELCAVLGDAAVTGFHVSELALDHAERMPDLRPDHRDDAVDRPNTRPSRKDSRAWCAAGPGQHDAALVDTLSVARQRVQFAAITA